MKILLLLFGAIFLFHPNKIKYSIEPLSSVHISLQTNLAKVNCKCLEKVSFDPVLIAEFNEDKGYYKFKNTALNLEVKKINCRNRGINQDLQETLLAHKFPNIELEIISIKQGTFKAYNSPQFVDVKAFLTIAGKKLPQVIKTSVTKTQANTYRLHASQEISLSEYGIEPKSSLKFVKIEDKAKVLIDLLIKLKPE